MLETWLKFLQSQPVLVFFLVLSLGYALGRIRMGGISLGSAGGVLLAGLFFGHLGCTMNAEIQTLGFAMFIFCVGYQAGPQFFDVLLTDGLKYFLLALVVAGTGFGLTYVLAQILNFEPGMAAGMLGGALTTTPTLAAAQDAVSSGIADIPQGFTEAEVLGNIGAGYALTYLFGLIGLIVSIRVLPKLLKIDLAKEAAQLAVGKEHEGISLGEVTRRVYRITKPDGLERTVGEIESATRSSLAIVAVWRDEEMLAVTYDTKLQFGDEVLVIGDRKLLLEHALAVGEEVPDRGAMDVKMSTVRVVVSKKAVTGMPIGDLKKRGHLGVLPLSAYRYRTLLPLTNDLQLKLGDVFTFYGPESSFAELTELVGHVERDVVDTDLLTFGLGIVLGIAAGTLAVKAGGVNIGLGMAGGLLITGLVIGFIRSIWPLFGRVPDASRWVLMELGLMMFMAGVGLHSGGGVVETIQESGLKLLGAGVIVTILPVLVGYVFSTKVLKLSAVEAFGGVTGAMTSGAALSVVCDAAKSNVPALAYTGAYAFANVILTIAGTLMMLVL